MNIPNDAIMHIYAYLDFDKHCFVNKEIYYFCKNKKIQEFYCGECSNTTCGHIKCNILFKYNEVIGLNYDEFGGYSRIYKEHEILLCNNCFWITFVKFYLQFAYLPHLRGDGELMYLYIKNIRKTLLPENYIQLITNSTFQKLHNIIFENNDKYENIYDVQYNKKTKYDTIYIVNKMKLNINIFDLHINNIKNKIL